MWASCNIINGDHSGETEKEWKLQNEKQRDKRREREWEWERTENEQKSRWLKINYDLCFSNMKQKTDEPIIANRKIIYLIIIIKSAAPWTPNWFETMQSILLIINTRRVPIQFIIYQNIIFVVVVQQVICLFAQFYIRINWYIDLIWVRKWLLLLTMYGPAWNKIVFPLFVWHMPTDKICPFGTCISVHSFFLLFLSSLRQEKNWILRKKNCRIYNVIDWSAPAHVLVIRNQSEEIRDIRLGTMKFTTTVATNQKKKKRIKKMNTKKLQPASYK